MPTFTAISVDRLIEPGASRSAKKPASRSRPPPNPNPNPIPISNPKLNRRHSISAVDRKVQRPPINPELYATPKATPLPDLPTSFPRSPYIIDHKRRGPRLSKSVSEIDVAACRKALEDQESCSTEKTAENEVVSPYRQDSLTNSASGPSEKEEHTNASQQSEVGSKEALYGISNGKPRGDNLRRVSSDARFVNSKYINVLSAESDSVKNTPPSSKRGGENEDFFDPQDSSNYVSNTDGEESSNKNRAEHASSSATAAGEFYDAWDELSSDGVTQSSLHDVEAELREIRLSLLMEIENRKQAEEALKSMRTQWQTIRQQLLHVGLTLPADPTVEVDEQVDADPVEELCQQITLARYVSESIGRGIAKAEAETELEVQIETKDFEIARLVDRLHYYETVNREMFQRNQEAVEMARRNRHKRKRKQNWVWGSVAAAITIGTAALLWSYVPAAKGSPSISNPSAPEHDD